MAYNSSIQFKILLPIIILLIVGLSASAWQIMAYFSNYAHSNLQSTLEEKATFMQKVSPQYITNFDLTALEGFVEELQKNPNILYALFADTAGSALTQNTTKPDQTPRNAKTIEMPVSDDYGTQVGEFELGYTTALIDQEITQKSILVAAIFMGLVLLLTIIVALVTRKILRPLKMLEAEIASATDNADLSTQILVSTNDEAGRVGQALNKFFATLNGLLKNVSTTANEVSSGNTEMETHITQISERLSHQGASINEIVQAIEEATESLHQVNHATQQVSDNLDGVIQKAHQADTAVRELSENSDQITEFTKIINDIAAQTNLLALNAAIEAARAGDAGRGFAVVAEEVKKLADQTVSATTQIMSIIETLQSSIHHTQKEFGTVTNSVKSIDDEMKQVAEATTRQSSAVEEINATVQSFTQQIEDSNNAVTDTINIATQLNTRAQSLQTEVNRFKL